MAKSSASSVLALEFSPAFMKLVEFSPMENRIATVAIKPMDASRWNDDAYLEDQIKTVVSRHAHGKNLDLVTAVSAGHAMLRTVEVPEGEENIQDALEWDMEQFLARPLDEYLMDYQALGSNESENSRLYLVAAYRKTEVERVRRLAESTGFPLSVLDVDVFAALNAFEANYPELQSGKTFLIKADSDSISCVTARNGAFIGCDTAPVDAGMADLTGQARTDRLLDLIASVRNRLDAARRMGGEVDHVILCGDLARDIEFSEMLTSSLPIAPITLDAFKQMSFIGSDSIPVEIVPSAPQIASALGLALRRRGDC